MSEYVGTELDVFGHAHNWKAYLRSRITKYLRGRVLEVGGGIGATTSAFRDAAQDRWTALEPDPALAARLRAHIARHRWPVSVVAGTLDAVPEAPLFDCILYIDVLEHIEDDRGELVKAVKRLVTGGAVVVLSPAHQTLYTPFDKAIGHYRRYNRSMLESLTPPGTSLDCMEYLDCVGLSLSLGNKLLLRSSSPTLTQVRFWDQWCVPLSRRLDGLWGRRLGKSILAVWIRNRVP